MYALDCIFCVKILLFCSRSRHAHVFPMWELLGKQEVSSKKVIVQANRALRSLNKDSRTVKGSKRSLRWTIMTQEGLKCPKNWDQNGWKMGPTWWDDQGSKYLKSVQCSSWKNFQSVSYWSNLKPISIGPNWNSGISIHFADDLKVIVLLSSVYTVKREIFGSSNFRGISRSVSIHEN